MIYDRLIVNQGNHKFRVSIEDVNEHYSVDFAPIIELWEDKGVNFPNDLAIYHLQARPYTFIERWLHGIYWQGCYYCAPAFSYHCKGNLNISSLETGKAINPHHCLIFPHVQSVELKNEQTLLIKAIKD